MNVGLGLLMGVQALGGAIVALTKTEYTVEVYATERELLGCGSNLRGWVALPGRRFEKEEEASASLRQLERYLPRNEYLGRTRVGTRLVFR